MHVFSDIGSECLTFFDPPCMLIRVRCLAPRDPTVHIEEIQG